MSLQPGAVVGPYVVREALGAGGMGEVYVAHDSRLDRDVALKVLPASYAADRDRLRRFEQEARAVSALNHPAIVTVHDFGHVDGHPYLCMELVRGETLRQVLASGALPVRRAIAIAAQVADGLAKAHDAGIVHRDLKPDNIMVTTDGFAKILDFGLAKLIQAAHENADTVVASGTIAGTVLGTAGYMSPEQASGQPADTRSDQFSFGAVVYEMLTGRRAFDKPTTVETLSAIVRDDVPPVSTVQPAVPAPLSWIVDRCLSKSPAERYASTRDLARDLATARDRLSELTSGAIPRPGAAQSRLRPREAAGWLVALAALAIAGVLGWRQAARPESEAPQVRFTLGPPEGAQFVSTLASPPFSLSPDGRHLAFLAASSTGVRSLWIRSLDSLQARQLPGTEQAAGMFWSPDGAHVAFFTVNALKRVPVAGGDAITLAPANRGGGGGSWSADGVILFAAGLDGGLSRVPAAGGTVTAVTTLDASNDESAHVLPVLLPDGDHFIYRIMGRRNFGWYVSSLSDPSPRRIADAEPIVSFAVGHLFFARDRTLWAQKWDDQQLALAGEPVRVADNVDVSAASAGYSVSGTGTVIYWPGSFTITQPTWVSRTGAVLGTLGQPGAYGTVALSPDGMEAALERFDDASIWRLDMRGAMTRVTRGAAFASTPVWRRDGKAIVFAKSVHSPPNLFEKDLERDVEEKLLFWNKYQSFPQGLSPDSKSLVYTTIEPETGNDLWLVELGGEPGAQGLPRRPLIVTPFNEAYGRISPDGRWLAFTSNESGRSNVYVTPFAAPARKRAVSSGNGRYPVWSRDGRELFFLSGGMVTSVSIGGGEGLEIGTPVPLFEAKTSEATLGAATPFDVAADGRFLVQRVVERTSPQATVILNWRPGLP